MLENSCRTEVEKLQNEVGFLHWQLVQLSMAFNPYGEFINVSPMFHLRRSRWTGSERSGEGMKNWKGILGEQDSEINGVAQKLLRNRRAAGQHFRAQLSQFRIVRLQSGNEFPTRAHIAALTEQHAAGKDVGAIHEVPCEPRYALVGRAEGALLRIWSAM